MTSPTHLIADGFSFLESPRWWDGDLYVSDFYTHRVLRFPAGRGPAQTVVEVPQQPSGLVRAANGDVLIVSMLDRTLYRWDGGALTIVADLAPYATGPTNDAVADRGGRTWIGNFGAVGDAIPPASIVTVAADGRATVAAEGLNFPNGMVLTDDESTLLVAETFAARITAFDVEEDGTLSHRRTWADLGEGDLWDIPDASSRQPVLPDGIALDAEGALWMADAKGNGALRLAEGGTVLDRVDTGGLAVYAVGFGGDQGRELFLCCAPPFGTADPSTSRNAQLRSTMVTVPGAVA